MNVSLLGVISFLIMYVGTHYLIGRARDMTQKEFETDHDNDELKKRLNTYNILFKWYAPIYLIVVLLYFSM